MPFLKTVAAAILLLTFGRATGQSAQVGINIHDHLLIREVARVSGERPDARYEGSPFLTDEFKPGQVSTEKVKFVPVPMRYNIADDVMEYQVGSTGYLLDADPKITRIEIGDEVFMVCGKRKPGFYKVQLEGELSVVAKLIVNLRPENNLTGVPGKYSRQRDTYYLMGANRSIEKVTNLKNFLAFLPERKEEVAQYASSEKLSPTDYDHLILLVKYYNSLVAGGESGN